MIQENFDWEKYWEDKIDCKRCGGSGILWNNLTNSDCDCHICKGSGWIYKSEVSKKQ